MFYSHEILTSRKHGVATVWLVATLGSRSALRKVTRKAILDVDVQGACETIVNPDAPLALRLQGSLLYGVSRVYSQQCGYVLSDTRAIRDKMMQALSLLSAAKNSGLDPNAGKASLEQLNVPEDLSFLDDFALRFDLSTLGPIADPLQSSLLSIGSSRSIESGEAAMPALELGSGSTPSGLGGFGTGGESSSAQGPGSRTARSTLLELAGEFDEPQFTIDDDFSLIDIIVPNSGGPAAEVTHARPASTPIPRGDEGIMVQVEPMDEDAGLIGTGEDDQVPTAEDATEESSQLATTRPSEQPETTVEAPQKRQKRAPQPLQTDARQELTNDILRGWTQDYLHNMEDARRVKRRHNVFEAKKIAAYFVYGQGIGSVGAGLGQDKVAGPLVHFSGHELLQALLAPPNGRKHARSPSLTSSEERRVRVRSDEEERSRHGQDIAMADEAGIIGVGDEDIEFGREAPPSLPEHHSSLPWNVSASRYNSGRPGSGAVSSSLAGGHGGMELGSLPPVSRRRSRVMSSSPLGGRGASIGRMSQLQIPSHGRPSTGDEGDFGIELQTSIVASEDFNALPPMESQAAVAALDVESHNFFDFVSAGIAALRRVDEETDAITFASLLPPEEHRKDVAAQAFLHVLTLASKGLIEVVQEEADGGEITIGFMEEL